MVMLQGLALNLTACSTTSSQKDGKIVLQPQRETLRVHWRIQDLGFRGVQGSGRSAF